MPSYEIDIGLSFGQLAQLTALANERGVTPAEVAQEAIAEFLASELTAATGDEWPDEVITIPAEALDAFDNEDLDDLHE